MSWISKLLGRIALSVALAAVVGWPALATVLEASRAIAHREDALGGTGSSLDPAGSAALLREPGDWRGRSAWRWRRSSWSSPPWRSRCPWAFCWPSCCFGPTSRAAAAAGAVGLAAFVPLPLHATAWLGALGNAGRVQAFGVRPILVGRTGAAVVHALAALPWVVLIVGVGLCAVEPELEESALLDYAPVRVWLRVTLAGHAERSPRPRWPWRCSPRVT